MDLAKAGLSLNIQHALIIIKFYVSKKSPGFVKNLFNAVFFLPLFCLLFS